jgi:hypothetical protein
MNRRLPIDSEQTHFPVSESGGLPAAENRPELPLDERLERAADRFEDQVAQWEQQSFDADLNEQIKEIERYEGFIQDVVENPERSVIGPLAFAEKKMRTTGPGDRRRMRQRLRQSPVPPERRQRRYGKAQGQGNNRVLDHHGAARWFERPGNHERLTTIKQALSDEAVVRARAA